MLIIDLHSIWHATALAVGCLVMVWLLMRIVRWLRKPWAPKHSTLTSDQEDARIRRDLGM